MIIGLALRHYKVYKNKKFIPIGSEHNFVAYCGENGVGKSSILEALDTFLNKKEWFVTKGSEKANSYICHMFLIPKSKVVNKQKNDFESVSNFFWTLEKKQKSDEFFDIRDSLPDYYKNEFYLLFIGEGYGGTTEVPIEASLFKKQFPSIGKGFLDIIKNIYSYVYFPVELNLEDFTKIQTNEMQKIFNTKLKDIIKGCVDTRGIKKTNDDLKVFVNTIEEKLGGEYKYDTGDTGAKKLSPTSLIDTISEDFFKRRVLIKNSNDGDKKLSELSAGEKRQALIKLIHAFLKDCQRDTIDIIGIDEPESSLHTSICYNQFEKLKNISENIQVFVTTHWYGFLPITDKGLVYFINKDSNNEAIFHDKINLYDHSYKLPKKPKDFILKSTNDLVQSIFHSLKTNKPYNWLICEGISDKIYLNYFLKDKIKNNNLRIIAVGGVEQVKKIYRYLYLPMFENCDNLGSGKVFCLTDTDDQLNTNQITNAEELKKHLTIRRFCILENNNLKSSLINFDSNKSTPMDMEKSLNPHILQETYKRICLQGSKECLTNDKIVDKDGNTTLYNLKNFEIDNYLSNCNKNSLATEYISVQSEKEGGNKFTPKWISEIIEFFNFN